MRTDRGSGFHLDIFTERTYKKWVSFPIGPFHIAARQVRRVAGVGCVGIDI
jgi:hypothetical protein